MVKKVAVYNEEGCFSFVLAKHPETIKVVEKSATCRRVDCPYRTGIYRFTIWSGRNVPYDNVRVDKFYPDGECETPYQEIVERPSPWDGYERETYKKKINQLKVDYKSLIHQLYSEGYRVVTNGFEDLTAKLYGSEVFSCFSEDASEEQRVIGLGRYIRPLIIE